MDNVVATPHLGYVEKDGYELYFRRLPEHRGLRRRHAANVLNPEALG
jgi:D-3-phosphoglycerate dehydrogenase